MAYPITKHHVRGARALMAPQYQNLSDQDITNYIYQQTASLSAEDAEGFLDSLADFGKTAGKFALQAVPTVAPILGTAAGTLIGGPIGAQIGGAIGNTAGQFASNISKGQSPGQAIKGAAISGAQGALGSVSNLLGASGSPFGNILGGLAGAVGGAIGGGGGSKPAASILSNFLSNPQVTGSIGSLLMGGAGQKSVPVSAGGQSFNFNPAQILGTLGSLASQASLEAAEDAEDTGYAYLLNPDGSFAVDPNNPEQRAKRMYDIFQQQKRESKRYYPEYIEPTQQPLTMESWFEDAGWMVN